LTFEWSAEFASCYGVNLAFAGFGVGVGVADGLSVAGDLFHIGGEPRRRQILYSRTLNGRHRAEVTDETDFLPVC
jgi:hypothetical protein